MKTNYQAFADRIKKVNNKNGFRKLEKSLDNLLVNGALTVSEYQRLDGKLMDAKEKDY